MGEARHGEDVDVVIWGWGGGCGWGGGGGCCKASADAVEEEWVVPEDGCWAGEKWVWCGSDTARLCWDGGWSVEAQVGREDAVS